MPGGRHRFEFVGKEPLVFWIVTSLLFANTALMLLLDFAGKYFLPNGIPKTVHWYENNSLIIQFGLIALLAAISIIFRKRIRYIRPE